jgi:hypothetical protein
MRERKRKILYDSLRIGRMGYIQNYVQWKPEKEFGN